MPYFVRVKDPSTGHQFDVPETDPRIGKVFTALDSDRYPRARSPRPPKHYVPTRTAKPVERGESDTSPASDTPAKDTTEAVETPEPKPARANSRK